MTFEQFEKAKELHAEIELAMDVENLLLNWKTHDGNENVLMMMYGRDSFNVGGVCNKIEKCPTELRNKLIQTCRDYYHELNKQFNEI